MCVCGGGGVWGRGGYKAVIILWEIRPDKETSQEVSKSCLGQLPTLSICLSEKKNILD